MIITESVRLLINTHKAQTFPLAVPPATPMRNGCRISCPFSARSFRCVSLSPAMLAVKHKSVCRYSNNTHTHTERDSAPPTVPITAFSSKIMQNLHCNLFFFTFQFTRFFFIVICIFSVYSLNKNNQVPFKYSLFMCSLFLL